MLTCRPFLRGHCWVSPRGWDTTILVNPRKPELMANLMKWQAAGKGRAADEVELSLADFFLAFALLLWVFSWQKGGRRWSYLCDPSIFSCAWKYREHGFVKDSPQKTSFVSNEKSTQTYWPDMNNIGVCIFQWENLETLTVWRPLFLLAHGVKSG